MLCESNGTSRSTEDLARDWFAPPGSSAADLERLFQDACTNASPSQQSLLQEVKTLGRYPNRYQHPANKAEAGKALPPRDDWWVEAETKSQTPYEGKKLLLKVEAPTRREAKFIQPKSKASRNEGSKHDLAAKVVSLAAIEAFRSVL